MKKLVSYLNYRLIDLDNACEFIKTVYLELSKDKSTSENKYINLQLRNEIVHDLATYDSHPKLIDFDSYIDLAGC